MYSQLFKLRLYVHCLQLLTNYTFHPRTYSHVHQILRFPCVPLAIYIMSPLSDQHIYLIMHALGYTQYTVITPVTQNICCYLDDLHQSETLRPSRYTPPTAHYINVVNVIGLIHMLSYEISNDSLMPIVIGLIQLSTFMKHNILISIIFMFLNVLLMKCCLLHRN